MATYGVTEAQKRFSELLDRAVAGEEVVIMMDGQPVYMLPHQKPGVQPASRVEENRLSSAKKSRV